MKNIKSFFKIIKLIEKKPLYWTGTISKSIFNLISNVIIGLWFSISLDSAISGNMPGVTNAMFFGFGAMFVLAFFYFISNYLHEKNVVRTTAKIRKNLFDKIQKLPLKYKDLNHSGDLISVNTNDIMETEKIYGQNFVFLFGGFLGAVGATVVIMYINWKIGLISISLGLLFTLINIPFINPLGKLSDLFQKTTAKMTENFTDIVASNQITKMYNLENKIEKNFEEINNNLTNISMKRVKKNASMNFINTLSSTFSFIGLLIIGGYFVASGQETVGNVIFIIQVLNSITSFMTQAGTFITRMQSSIAAGKRVINILETETEEESYNLKDCSKNHDLAINIKNLDFSYSENTPVFKNFNLEIEKNKVYALVGPSGCGKSTLMKVLMGFYKPQDGSISINNKDFCSNSIKEIREEFSYVPQQSYLFTGTIKENIQYGRYNCDIEEIIEASKLAYAHDFIKELPEGYFSKVGERGTRLSGGQKQRIAIARAINKKAPILLLDEATSALDNESEEQVQKALDNLMIGKTVLVVAHRLSTIQNADKIFVMDKGEIIQLGTHEELLKKEGLYKKLYEIQFQTSKKTA